MKLEKDSADVSSVDISEELHSAVTRLAGPRDWSDTREAWIARASRRAGVSFRTAKSLFYREIKDPKWSVVDAVLSAAKRFDEEQESKVQDEYDAVVARMAALEARLAELDREKAHSGGVAHRPVDQHEEGGVKG